MYLVDIFFLREYFLFFFLANYLVIGHNVWIGVVMGFLITLSITSDISLNTSSSDFESVLMIFQ